MDSMQGDIRPYATQQDVINFVDSLYGMKVLTIKVLNGYDDQNFHVMVDLNVNDNPNNEGRLCKQGYVFKVLNSTDSVKEQDHLAAQLLLLTHLQEKGVVCPRHITDKNGQLFSEQQLPNKERTSTRMHLVRLLEYIEGDIIGSRTTLSPQLAYNGGEFLAKLQIAIEGFDDKRLIKEGYLWNMDSIPLLRQYLEFVEDSEYRTITEQVLQKWDEHQPLIAKLPYGPIHSDFNDQNVLVQRRGDGDDTVVGILDFQDSSYGQKVFDVAIYMMYTMSMLSDGQNCLDVGGHCLRGYIDHKELSDSELEVLYYCIAGRLVQSMVLGLYNYSIHKDPYLLLTQKGWEPMKILWSKPAKEVLQYWLSDKFARGKKDLLR